MASASDKIASFAVQSERVEILKELLELDSDELKKTLLFQLNKELRSVESDGFLIAEEILHINNEQKEEIVHVDSEMLASHVTRFQLAEPLLPFLQNVDVLANVVLDYVLTVNEGLVGYWPLNNLTRGRDCTEPSGLISTYPATNFHMGGTVWAQLYDAEDDCASFKKGYRINTPPIKGTPLDCGEDCTGLTMACWVQRTGACDGPLCNFETPPTGWNVHFWLQFTDKLYCRMNGPKGEPFVDYVLDTRENEIGEWHFVAATIERKTCMNRIFCDGELRQEKVVHSKPYPLGTVGQICIGELDRRQLFAKVKGLQVWRRALSAEELRLVSKWDQPDRLVTIIKSGDVVSSSSSASADC